VRDDPELGRRSGGALIAVVKSADLRERHDAPARWRLDFARMRAVVVEGLMRAGGIVVGEVPAQQTAEVPFVDHDDVIEAFPTNRADDALGEGILPMASLSRSRYLGWVSPGSFRPVGGRSRRRWGGR
jgi:hypothetical protein